MKHSEFKIGSRFTTDTGTWRVTDVGTRVVVAIRVDAVEAVRHNGTTGESVSRTIPGPEAEAEGWFRGPPYAVAERVFDEDDQVACSPCVG